MASDYKKIAEDHEKRYGWDAKPRRIYKRLYSNKTHFVYELIQNADDSGSDCLELQLNSNTLLVWNDGRQFTEEDVRNICSLGSSDKDLTNIGTFGIGFKAVYNYTDFPEIYSDDEGFRIRDFIKPEGIDERPPEIEKLVSEGKTIFRLPFKDNPHQVDDIDHLKDRLCNLSKERSLLFLRHLESVEWKDEHNAQKGSYACRRHPYDKIQNVPENECVQLVELIGTLNGNDKPSETFLVFRKKIHPPKDVIGKLLEQAEDEEEQQSIQQSAEELQPIEVAFKLQDGRITAMDDNCVLFAYLPTQKETRLKFLIQARYQTTPSRDNIPKPSENPWNKWLVRETAKFLPEILEQLKASDLLEPAFFNVLPLKDKVKNEFKPIAEALQKAMQERAFVPIENGRYAKAEAVFYPHRESLLQLIETSWLYPGSSWLHQDIGRSGHAFNVMKEAGVKEINVAHVLNWLEKRDLNWFENRCEKWLRSLYVYLNDQKSQLERINGLERIKKLPLVRLENERHVCVSDQLVYFPPDTDEARDEIGPFLNELPILRSTLLKGEDHSNINEFLRRKLGVKMLRSRSLITESICPLYSQSNKPAIMKNRWHVRYIFKSWQKAAESERSRLEESVSKVPILQAYKGIQRETSDFVVPRNAYLPQAYTGDNDLETYFSVSDGNFWFVDDKYLTSKSDRKVWFQFLKAIEAMDTPRVIKMDIPVDYEAFSQRSIRRSRITRTGEETIEDRYLYGLSVVLNEIREHRNVKLSQVLWSLLVKALPLAEQARETFFKETYKGIYRSKYRSNSYTESDHFDAVFYRHLKSVAWIPDKQGNLHKPSKYFAPTSENRELLGDSEFYLPDSFNISTGTATWLAKHLDIHVKIDDKDVLKRLRDLSGTDVSVKEVEPLYRFLYDNRPRRRVEPEFNIRSYMGDAIPSWRQTFKEESLIFIPEPKPHWWLTDEVFWEDESPVFGNDRGYLKAYYSEDLKSFFTTSLEVPQRADTLDYIRGIQDIASKARVETQEIRGRIQRLYRRLWLSLQESGNSLETEEWQEEWMQICEDACWLGKKGNEWGFFSPQKLVWKDDDYRSELFKNKVPFWGFDHDLLELAKELGVKGCYTDSDIEFDYCEDQGEDTDWSAKVRDLAQNLHDFLNSPHLCGEHEEEKSTQVLNRLSVRRVEKLEARFELNGISVPDPEPRPSFLKVTDQEAVLGLASEASEDQYPWLIGDALQAHFGDVKELSAFVEDLLTKGKESVLIRWKQKGLRTNIDVSSPEEDSKEDEEDQTGPVDNKLPDELNSTNADTLVDESDVGIPTDDEDNDSIADAPEGIGVHFSNNEGNNSTVDESEVEAPVDDGTQEIDKADGASLNKEVPTTSTTAQTTNSGSEHGTPQVNESPEIEDRGPNSATKGSGARTYNPSGTSRTSRSGGHSLSISSNRGSSGGGHGGSGGGGEGEEHENLKKDLANNPSQLGEGLELIKIEYTFGSGDRVDILLKDGSENPVTVEVETGFSSGTGRYVGVWQAVKYQHLAAMEYGLPCQEVRSILAAPEIPEDVKKKCEELGIEPIEVSQE